MVPIAIRSERFLCALFPDNLACHSQLMKLDSSFDPFSEEAQLHLLGFCDDLFNQEFADKIIAHCSCPLQMFDAWLKEQSSATSPCDVCVEHPSGASGAPVAQDQFHPCFFRGLVRQKR